MNLCRSKSSGVICTRAAGHGGEHARLEREHAIAKTYARRLQLQPIIDKLTRDQKYNASKKGRRRNKKMAKTPYRKGYKAGYAAGFRAGQKPAEED